MTRREQWRGKKIFLKSKNNYFQTGFTTSAKCKLKTDKYVNIRGCIGRTEEGIIS